MVEQIFEGIIKNMKQKNYIDVLECLKIQRLVVNELLEYSKGFLQKGREMYFEITFGILI